MNCKIFDKFDMIKIEEQHLSDTLRSIIHTVAFQRALGLTEPEDVFIEILDLNYVKCKSKTLDASIETDIEKLISSWKKDKKKILKFIINFKEYVARPGVFLKNTIEVSSSPWEQWAFSIEIGASDALSNDIVGKSLQSLLQTVVETALSNLNHLPALFSKKEIPPDDPRPWPMEVGSPSTPSSEGRYFGFVDNFFKIL
uniref:Autophagy-related protein 101 n=1 Tax=Arcella intermedia TaxID=1963864 RepID=A0A6B2LK71_9EUKA